MGWDMAQVASWDQLLVLVRPDSPATNRGSSVFAGSVLASHPKFPGSLGGEAVIVPCPALTTAAQGCVEAGGTI